MFKPSPTQLLIKVVVQNQQGSSEESTFRVAADARFTDVVRAATDRSELIGLVRCTHLVPLGTLEPHLHQYYTNLLDPRCVTDIP
jgi:hypothetical protein